MQHPPQIAPLILSLRLDDASFETLNGLREQHFPRERNHLDAHVTLFHALPGEQEARIRRDLKEFCSCTSRLPLSFSRPRFLVRGVAIDIECPELIRLRAHLAKEWRDWLGPQDAQGWKHPHVTVQNKVAPETARALFEQLSASWKALDGQGEGLSLWRYLGGPWKAAEGFGFQL
jgi:hypothetical protein